MLSLCLLADENNFSHIVVANQNFVLFPFVLYYTLFLCVYLFVS